MTAFWAAYHRESRARLLGLTQREPAKRRRVALSSNSDQNSWSEQEIAKMRRLLVEDGLSSKAAALRMHRSKTSIIAAANRYGVIWSPDLARWVDRPEPPEPAALTHWAVRA